MLAELSVWHVVFGVAVVFAVGVVIGGLAVAKPVKPQKSFDQYDPWDWD